jgi:hypothetical protein
MHARGHLRDEFLELVEEDDYLQNQEKMRSMMRICGKLWNCSDIIPSSTRSDLDDLFELCFDDYQFKRVYTYAQAARKMREILKLPVPERNRLIFPCSSPEL